MATTSAGNFKTRYPFPVGAARTDAPLITNTLTGGALNDIVRIASVPRGITFLDALVQTASLDSNATPLVQFSVILTDGTTTKTLIAANTTGQAGGVKRVSSAAEDAVGFTTTNGNFQLQVKWTTAAATGAAGVFTLIPLVSGHYSATVAAND